MASEDPRVATQRGREDHLLPVGRLLGWNTQRPSAAAGDTRQRLMLVQPKGAL